MKFLADIIKGIFIGAGAILPGISSGVLCVIFGIYEKLLDSVLNFFKEVKNNFKFLFPIIIGGFIGVISFTRIIEYLLYKYPLQTKSIFVGFILGGAILLFRDINKEGKSKTKNYICLIISLVIGFLMVILKDKIEINSLENVSFAYLIFCGFLMSFGIIVPGVSSTIILMLLRIYPLYLNSVSNLYLPVLIPMGIGIIIGSLILMKGIKVLLDKFYAQTMYAIIGFTIGSTFVLFPTISSILELIISILCIVLGYLVIRVIEK